MYIGVYVIINSELCVFLYLTCNYSVCRLDDLFVVDLTFLHGYKTPTIAYIAEVTSGLCDSMYTPLTPLLDEGQSAAEGVLSVNE